MHKRQKQFNPSGIKWPSEVDMPLKKTQTQFILVVCVCVCVCVHMQPFCHRQDATQSIFK